MRAQRQNYHKLQMKNRSESKNQRQSYLIRKYTLSQTKKQPQRDPVVFMIVDDEHIGIYLPYALSNDLAKSLIKQNGGFWCHNGRHWKIPRTSYTPVRSQLPRLVPDVEIQDIPLFMDKASKPIPEKLKINSTNQIITYDPMDKRIQATQNPLYQKLYQFQKCTLQHAIRNFGRLLIGDEMGIGKTLQSLACALAYENDWPLLIICPSALKHVWEEQVKKWLGNRIKKQYIQLIEKYGTPLDFSVLRIAIFSYQIASKSVEHLTKFNVVIADEAHYLKNSNAKRTENLVPFLMTRKRVFLLSGTAAQAKPRQVFNLIQIIRPDIFYSLKQFGDRYCVLERNKWTHRMEYDGSRNLAELHYILKNKVMIRRLKTEVLYELPEKQRQIIELQTNKNYIKQIKQLMNSNEIPLDVLRNNEKLLQMGQNSDGMSPLPRCYLLSGLAKLQGVKTYLSSLFQNDVKILVFAHHKAVMDELEQHLQGIKIQYIRIDGSTTNDVRKKYVKNFQEDMNIKAALLSITAAGVGLTLTAASTVVFAQLHWTPANLIQAEDRAHRIGQKSCVNVHYLVGENTLDHILLKQLQKKLQTTGDILNGTKQNLSAENLQKGKIGRLSHPKFQNTQPKTQRSILQYTKQKTPPKSQNIAQHSDSDIDEDELPQDELQKLIAIKQTEIRERNKLKVLSKIMTNKK